jgi:uncharacterized membrane protein YqjE
MAAEEESAMAEPSAAGPPDGGGQSVGDLVSLAIRDASRLVRAELDLAKLELRDDARRIGLASGLTVMALFASCLVLMLLCFAYAFGLIAAGIWAWAAFLIVAGTCVLLAAATMAVVYLKVRRVSGLRKTRATVQDDLALLRREDNNRAVPAPGQSG